MYEDGCTTEERRENADLITDNVHKKQAHLHVVAGRGECVCVRVCVCVCALPGCCGAFRTVLPQGQQPSSAAPPKRDERERERESMQ